MDLSFLRLIVISFLFFCTSAYGADPLLRFSDVTSGPDGGLGDGKGVGAIVTVWGNNLGSEQSGSKIYFKDSAGIEREAAYVYYWKNADGSLPGGPANLYASHKMQEIAFSIPDAAVGNGEIYVKTENNSVTSNALPFRVSTTGNIYFVSPEGNNSNICSYESPCEFVNGNINSSGAAGLADGHLSAGDIVYSLGVAEPEFCSGGRCVSLFTRNINGTITDRISFIAYPGMSSKIVSQNTGLQPYHSSFISISKYSLFVGHADPDLPPNPGNPIQSDTHIVSANGRYVGNYLGQNPGTCITGWSGSISSGGAGGSYARIYGNEIDSLGCPNTSRFMHTTYMSIRNENVEVEEPWDFSFNYLHDNYPMFGIHFYDEQYDSSGTGGCGVLNGTLRVTNNVIVNQWGPGVNIATSDRVGVKNPCWSADIHIENNLLINTGLGDTLDDNVTPPPVAIRLGGDITPDVVNIFNNTVYQWGSETSIANAGNPAGIQLGFNLSGSGTNVKVFNNHFISNIVESSQDAFVRITNTDNMVTGKNNAFYTPDTTPTTAIPPSAWIENILLSTPGLMIIGDNYNASGCTLGSDLINKGTQNSGDTELLMTHDIYGNSRTYYDIGAIEYVGSTGDDVNPRAPAGIQIK